MNIIKIKLVIVLFINEFMWENIKTKIKSY